MRKRRRTQDGQSAVELLALLPALIVVVLIGWQITVAGYAWTLAAGAARAGARAMEVGAPAHDAARAVLPVRYVRGAVVLSADGGRSVRVRLLAPQVLPFLPRLEYVAAEARTR